MKPAAPKISLRERIKTELPFYDPQNPSGLTFRNPWDSGENVVEKVLVNVMKRVTNDLYERAEFLPPADRSILIGLADEYAAQ